MDAIDVVDEGGVVCRPATLPLLAGLILSVAGLIEEVGVFFFDEDAVGGGTPVNDELIDGVLLCEVDAVAVGVMVVRELGRDDVVASAAGNVDGALLARDDEPVGDIEGLSPSDVGVNGRFGGIIDVGFIPAFDGDDDAGEEPLSLTPL